MKILSFATVGFVAVFTWSAAIASPLTDTYSSFWVLGDSLSDNGNLFALTGTPPAPYFNGRVSNGPVWNEQIIADFASENGQAPVVGNFGGETQLTFNGNFAFAGARADNETNPRIPIPGLLAQTLEFLSVTTPTDRGANPLVSVWAGANDIFQGLPLAATLEQVQGVGKAAARAVVQSVSTLGLSGVQNVMVFNLPDIGKTPAFSGSVAASMATTAFNQELAGGLAGLSPVLNIIEVDTFGTFNAIQSDPLAFGLSNASDACLDSLACVLGGDAVQDSYLFWDGVHPTAAGHRLIAETAISAATVPLPAGLPLMLAGIGGLGLMARRKRKAA
ncbi:MAG: SGNH/GDSL hydrolase family protein [Tateyamaria sp.]|uniref:SGNH/GDSL hydrolase family protein n=1 Tax=Tateyamaria sp. TaxID=1929288 RepID=UPI003292D36E